MRTRTWLLALSVVAASLGDARAADKLKVVVTLPFIGDVARAVGGDAVDVTVLARPGVDPHHFEPTPSEALAARDADLFIENGVQLELWTGRVIETSGNDAIKPGAKGHVYGSNGIKPLEIPTAEEIAAGGHVHPAGNPHVWLDPLNLKIFSANIETGLSAVRPDGAVRFAENRKTFDARIDDALYGPDLVKVLGGATLDRLQRSGRLRAFLREKQYEGRPLLEKAGGWLKKALSLEGLAVISFHKDWPYFEDAFGIKVVSTIEEKPGIAASPAWIEHLQDVASTTGARIVISTPYYPSSRAEGVADRIAGVAVVLPTQPGEADEATDVFKMFDTILDRLVDAHARVVKK